MLLAATALLASIRASARPVDFALCERALAFATAAHGEQQRKSGELYISHPIAVAERLWKLYGDAEMTAAAFLHDVLEDTHVTRDELYHEFGDMVGFMVDAVSKGFTDFQLFPRDPIPDRIERLLWAGMQDVRVLLIKLADRENNLMTVEQLRDDKQVRMSFETQAIFQPLVHILRFGQPSKPLSCVDLLKSFMASQGITTPRELKNTLIAASFSNVDDELFGLLYTDTKAIVWRIASRDQYAALVDDARTASKLDIISLRGHGDSFEASFRLMKAAILPSVQLEAAPYKSR